MNFPKNRAFFSPIPLKSCRDLDFCVGFMRVSARLGPIVGIDSRSILSSVSNGTGTPVASILSLSQEESQRIVLAIVG